MSELFSKYETAAKFERERLGVSKLTSAQKIEVEAAVKRNQERAHRKFATEHTDKSIVPQLEATRKKELKNYLYAYVVNHYRHSTSSWAGGMTDMKIHISHAPNACGSSKKVFSRNGKWSGSNTNLEITVQPAWRKYIGSLPGLAWAGGMLTTHAAAISNDCWQASWVVQKRGFNLGVKSGFIVKVGENFFHGKTEAAARKLAYRAKCENSTSDRLLLIATGEQLIVEFGDVVVKKSHSLKVNCETGTVHWIERYFPGRESATIKELIAADGSNPNVVAACKVAIRRQATKNLVSV